MSKKAGRAIWVLVVLALVVLWWTGYNNRRTVWKAQINYCERAVKPGQLDSAARDKDLELFAETSVKLRTDLGQYGLAAQAAGIEARAKVRAANAKKRAAIPCEIRFPKPSLFGLN